MPLIVISLNQTEHGGDINSSALITGRQQHSEDKLRMTKPTWHVRPAKTQISLGIRPVWSESSLSARRMIGSLASYWAQSEDLDQTGRMSRLIWVFAWRTLYFVGFVMRWLIYCWRIKLDWARTSEKSTFGHVRQRRFESSFEFAQSDQNFHWPQFWYHGYKVSSRRQKYSDQTVRVHKLIFLWAHLSDGTFSHNAA